MTVSYDSPTDLRKKLKLASKSSERWKTKHRASQYELKKARTTLSQALANRDEWRSKCHEQEQCVLQLEQELSNQLILASKTPSSHTSTKELASEKKLLGRIRSIEPPSRLLLSAMDHLCQPVTGNGSSHWF